MLGLGLVRGGSVVRRYINIREDIRLWTSRASYDCKGRPRKSITSAKREGVKRWVLLSRVTFQEVLLIRICTVNVLDKMGVEKYLGESCYHSIKCSVTNSLAVLMRKWCLNNTFQPYSNPQRFQEGADGTYPHKQSNVHVVNRDERGDVV